MSAARRAEPTRAANDRTNYGADGRTNDPAPDAGPRILVVEDEGIVALDIKQSLRRLGYTVVGTVTNGPDALETVSATPVDIVLMDIHLEGDMDGIETAGELRARHDIPVVYLTAYADDETLARARITEPFGYAVKPYEEVELKSAIEIGLYKHRMDRRLRKSEHRLDAVLRSIHDAVIVVDPDHHISFVNQTARELIKSPDTRPTFDIVGVMRAAGDTRIAEATNWPDEEPRPFQAQLRNQAGHTLPVEGTLSPVHDDDSAALGWVLVFRDITQRLRDAAIKTDLANIVTTSQDGIISVDADGRIETWNPAAETIFGYTDREARGQAIDELLFAASEHMAAELIAHIHEGRAYSLNDITAGTRHGEASHISLDFSPRRSETGHVTGASLIIHDLARRKALEREVHHLRAKLAERARSLV